MDSEPQSKKKTKNKKKKQTEPEPEPVQAKVKVVRENPNKIPPYIGYFPSGFDPVKSTSVSAGFQVYRNKNMTKRLELVVSPAGSSVDFVGTNYMGEATGSHRSMYALGVFDKESQTLKVVPIGANKIFRLDPKVKGVEYNLYKESANGTVEELSPEQTAAKRRHSTAVLGTKRHIESTNKILDMRKDDEPESKKNLVEKMKNVVVNEAALANTEATVSRNIPPYDTSATTPQEAYVLDRIILEREWSYLEDIYYILEQGEAANFSAYPIFIRNRIGRLKKIEDESEKKKQFCILSYINHLIKFKDQHSMDGVSSAKSHKIPTILRSKFLTMFDVSESKRLPTEKINLLISYVLVLTLFIDGFQTDYKDIAKDLRMSLIPLRLLYEHLGGKIVFQDKKSYAILPIPLTFPELKQKKRKR
ncbi:DNA-directed RNA polymerase I subunit rpa49 [Cicer arietinum]|uniref:DNA-directed RNA polymerase I subunit rpa49 n=1 Tax=Cicer arietinum TaxID=3827 RepID=A0A1S2XH65_CICAR|nr:DNA-directed RNA polymerase I subunit rpa49 [Cicer arietinum]